MEFASIWDGYVPYAVMPYRAMPHYSTKYSPYFLVFGREMRLPIEYDWQPCLKENKVEADYKQHVQMLAEWLREANKVAGHQSELSNF
jgi:hypothetical protein